jgi:hypothetical protein
MSLREDIHTRMSNYANLTALVSTRIYHSILPQNTPYPAVTYQTISGGEQIHTMNSDAGHPAHPRIQVSSWGLTQESAENVAAQVSACLKDFSGAMGNSTVQRIFQETSEPIYIYSIEAKIYQVIHDFTVWFT